MRALLILGTAVLTAGAATAQGVPYSAKQERVGDFGALIPEVDQRPPEQVKLERVTSGVPWPRGLAWVDDQLVVLARGRHRRSGGIDPKVEDMCGHLMLVDPNVAETVISGQPASDAVRANSRVLATPGQPLILFDAAHAPVDNYRIDRPYCTLIFDAESRNLFICGYSGVDLPKKRFRKNASDSIHRYDLRDRKWHPVEMHDASVVPTDALGYVVPNQYYPHHDPRENAAPHGWLNGPDGGCVAGRYLYCVGKDNHTVARYDLGAIRENPAAGPPASQLVLGSQVRLRHPRGERDVELLGPSAAELHGGYLYLGYRTSSVVVRFKVDEHGDLPPSPVAELVAAFEPWNPERKRSANLIDIAFNGKGELFVACAKEARIWKVGVPDPKQPFYGNDQTERATTAPPFVDLPGLTGTKAGAGNILFDPQDRLYVCAGNYDSGTAIAGAVYRVTELD